MLRRNGVSLMPARPCLGRPGRPCGVLTRNGSRCPSCTSGHQRTVDQRRGTASQRGYDAGWRALVAEAKHLQAQHYGRAFCLDCGTTGSADNPLTGDHLRWPAHTVDDVEIVCRVCNSRRPNRRTGVTRKC